MDENVLLHLVTDAVVEMLYVRSLPLSTVPVIKWYSRRSKITDVNSTQSRSRPFKMNSFDNLPVSYN